MRAPPAAYQLLGHLGGSPAAQLCVHCAAEAGEQLRPGGAGGCLEATLVDFRSDVGAC